MEAGSGKGVEEIWMFDTVDGNHAFTLGKSEPTPNRVQKTG
jgi:hypothetical protein